MAMGCFMINSLVLELTVLVGAIIWCRLLVVLLVGWTFGATSSGLVLSNVCSAVILRVESITVWVLVVMVNCVYCTIVRLVALGTFRLARLVASRSASIAMVVMCARGRVLVIVLTFVALVVVRMARTLGRSMVIECVVLVTAPGTLRSPRLRNRV